MKVLVYLTIEDDFIEDEDEEVEDDDDEEDVKPAKKRKIN
jgi:hypothetical protein